MVIIQPLYLCQGIQAQSLEEIFNQSVLGAVDILKPHGRQGHCADNIRQINHCPEKALEADAAGNDNGKQQRQGHDDDTADKPYPGQVPHGDAEQGGICQLHIVINTAEGPF